LCQYRGIDGRRRKISRIIFVKTEYSVATTGNDVTFAAMSFSLREKPVLSKAEVVAEGWKGYDHKSKVI